LKPWYGVVPEYGDVDVFRESGNQTEGLGQRSSALEENARAIGLEPIEKRVERPAYAEVFFDILDGGAQAGSRCGEQAGPACVARRNDLGIGGVHRGFCASAVFDGWRDALGRVTG